MGSLLRLISICLLTLAIAACSSTNSDNSSYGQARINFEQENYYNAFQGLLVPAAKGNPDAEYALGYMYYYGKGIAVDQVLGKEWITKAAEAGNLQAQQAYQMILSHEQSILSSPQGKSSPKSVALKKPAAKPLVKRHIKKAVAVSTVPLLLKNPSHYTVQILAADKLVDAQEYIKKHDLTRHAYIFNRQLRGKTFYVIIYGNFPTQQAALTAIKKLPSKVQALKPWVRSVRSVQNEIRMNQ